MDKILFTKIDDIDTEILLHLPAKNLYYAVQINKYIYTLCMNNNLLKKRIYYYIHKLPYITNFTNDCCSKPICHCCHYLIEKPLKCYYHINDNYIEDVLCQDCYNQCYDECHFNKSYKF